MLPMPWVIVGALGFWLLSSVGAFFYGEHVSSLSWEAASARQSADAASLLAKITTANAAKDAAASDFARQLDQGYADAQKQISDSSSAYQRDTALKLQQLAKAWQSRCSARAAQAAPVGLSTAAESERIVRLSKEYGQVAGDIVGNARSIQAELRQCKVWAKEHGR